MSSPSTPTPSALHNNTPPTIELAAALPPPIRLVIFDFDGTLFDTHASIAHTLAITFARILSSIDDNEDPVSTSASASASASASCLPSEAAIAASISAGLSLPETIRQLYPHPHPHPQPHSRAAGGAPHADIDKPPPLPPPPSLDGPLLERFLATYRALYQIHGQPLITPFSDVRNVLDALTAVHRRIPCAIVSNKGIAAVRDVLKRHELSSLIELVVGDGEPVGCPRKPDPGSWNLVVKPFFEQGTPLRAGLRGLQGGEVLVVGDTEADIMYARNIGARSMWCSYGYGTREKCLALEPDWVVGGLHEVVALLPGNQEER